MGLSQSTIWQSSMEEGRKLQEQAHYDEAQKAYSTAVAEAEKAGPDDPHLARSLNALATTYQDKGRYSDAEPLYQRALSIWEKSLEAGSAQPGGLPEQPGASLSQPGPIRRGRTSVASRTLVGRKSPGNGTF